MLLVSHYNTMLSEGNSLHDTILRGSLDRLNPILMTALTSALALIPLALGGDLPGNEIQSPMAKSHFRRIDNIDFPQCFCRSGRLLDYEP